MYPPKKTLRRVFFDPPGGPKKGLPEPKIEASQSQNLAKNEVPGGGSRSGVPEGEVQGVRK